MFSNRRLGQPAEGVSAQKECLMTKRLLLLLKVFQSKRPKLPSLGEMCHEVKADLPHITSMYLTMSIRYYADVLSQAKQSFYFALLAAGVGVVFFISAARGMMNGGKVQWISLIAGALLQVISGTCFYLYGKASAQFATFHICLDRSNRFLLANT